MRRAAVRAFRTARLVPSRNLTFRSRAAFPTSSYVLGIRHASGRTDPISKAASPKAVAPPNSSTSMYLRRFSVALVSGLVGYGAWYTYKDQSGSVTSATQQAQTFSTSAVSYGPDPTGTVERKALIVGPDELYTGAIRGNEPISKDTDESGRKVLEMLTPEQATQKLRRNEESYLVGRGQGVVRYDVVQIPSNDPIEDDHVEKIIELPQALATASGRNSSSDWMFWGVFDGHSYVRIFQYFKKYY